MVSDVTRGIARGPGYSSLSRGVMEIIFFSFTASDDGYFGILGHPSLSLSLHLWIHLLHILSLIFLFGARLPLVVCLVQRPDELPLIVLGHPGDVRPARDHLEAHQLQSVQDQPRGKAELCTLLTVVVVLGLVLDLLGQNADLKFA